MPAFSKDIAARKRMALKPSPSRGEPGFRAALPRAGERLHTDVQTGLTGQDARRFGWGWCSAIRRKLREKSIMKGQTNPRIRAARLPRQLRNTSTDAERALWQRLKARQIENCKFRRQHPYGDYILDFVCLERSVIVELDGSQHADAVVYDVHRTRFLETAGFMVLRFWNNDVFENIEGLLEVIQRQLVAGARTNPSPPNPPLEGEG